MPPFTRKRCHPPADCAIAAALLAGTRLDRLAAACVALYISQAYPFPKGTI